MRETAGVVDELLTVAFAELETVLLVDDDGVVGVAYLTAACAEHQFAIARDGEYALCLVAVLLLPVVIDVGVDGNGTCEEVGLRLAAGFEGEAGDSHIEEGGEEGEVVALLADVLFLGEQTVEVARLFLVGCFARHAGGGCPHGFVDLNELVAHIAVADDFRRLHFVEQLDGNSYLTHSCMKLDVNNMLYVVYRRAESNRLMPNAFNPFAPIRLARYLR